jgi:PEP-CTERM motif
MKVQSVFRSLSLLAVLVLVLGVAGAFADGITSGRHDGTLVTSDAIHALTPVAAWHTDFAFGRTDQSNGIRSGYLLRMSLLDGPTRDLAGLPPPSTATPEPGTVFMLIAGIGIVLFGLRRRATQS